MSSSSSSLHAIKLGPEMMAALIVCVILVHALFSSSSVARNNIEFLIILILLIIAYSMTNRDIRAFSFDNLRGASIMSMRSLSNLHDVFDKLTSYGLQSLQSALDAMTTGPKKKNVNSFASVPFITWTTWVDWIKRLVRFIKSAKREAFFFFEGDATPSADVTAADDSNPATATATTTTTTDSSLKTAITSSWLPGVDRIIKALHKDGDPDKPPEMLTADVDADRLGKAKAPITDADAVKKTLIEYKKIALFFCLLKTQSPKDYDALMKGLGAPPVQYENNEDDAT